MPIQIPFRFLFCSVFSLSFFTLMGQEWLQDHQQWSYDVTGGTAPSLQGIHTLSITGDTIIVDTECKVFIHEYPNPIGFFEEPDTIFAYTQDDAVYASYGDDFFKIYDFSMEPGDTLELPNDKRYRVDLTGTTIVNNQELRFQIVSTKKVYSWTNQWLSSYLILEGIGFIGKIGDNAMWSCSYFFINNIRCNAAFDGQDYHFKCFSDNDFLYDPYDLCTTTSTNRPTEQNFKISPNPASHFITITPSSNIDVWSITFYDLLGKTIYSDTVEDSQVDISHLPAQTYILMLTDQNGINYFSKLVVTQ